jgi:hypothetical protein
MIRVLGVRGDGAALVAAEGLYRIVVHPIELTVDELLEDWEADAFVETFNVVNKSGAYWAERVSYWGLRSPSLV